MEEIRHTHKILVRELDVKEMGVDGRILLKRLLKCKA
jgi:hypothetical protein